jgi:hypothetical protein
LLADPQSVLNRWKNFFNHVLNVHGVHDVRQVDIHTAEPLVPEPSLFKVEIAFGKLKSYKSPASDQIPAELIKAGVNTELYVLRGSSKIWCFLGSCSSSIYKFLEARRITQKCRR